jgi:hypothetical protein
VPSAVTISPNATTGRSVVTVSSSVASAASTGELTRRHGRRTPTAQVHRPSGFLSVAGGSTGCLASPLVEVRGRSVQRGRPRTDQPPPDRQTALDATDAETDPESGTRSLIQQDGSRGLVAAHGNPTPCTEPTPHQIRRRSNHSMP